MSKLKTKKSVAKRFKVTGSGKVKFKRSMKRHILTDRSQKRKRRLRHPGILTPGDAHEMMRCLPYGE